LYVQRIFVSPDGLADFPVFWFIAEIAAGALDLVEIAFGVGDGGAPAAIFAAQKSDRISKLRFINLTSLYGMKLWKLREILAYRRVARKSYEPKHSRSIGTTTTSPAITPGDRANASKKAVSGRSGPT
jgi:hypothetical protein